MNKNISGSLKIEKNAISFQKNQILNRDRETGDL